MNDSGVTRAGLGWLELLHLECLIFAWFSRGSLIQNERISLRVRASPSKIFLVGASEKLLII